MGDQVDFIVTQKKKHAPIPILSSPLLINNDRFLRAAGKKGVDLSVGFGTSAVNFVFKSLHPFFS